MIGEIIFNYKITKKIGEGSVGAVYLAEHQKLKNKFVAVKVLTPELSLNNELKSRFIEEANILSKLNHPGIASLIDFVEQNNRLIILMEYVQGYPLDIYIEKINGPIPEHRAVDIFKKILEAFNYAHNVGVIHGDIKPSNIFLLENDSPKILDFGIKKIVKGSANFSENYSGSIIYLSPEHISGSNIDARSDIYSLGVNLFYILTGNIPYDLSISSKYSISEKIKKEPLPPFTSINSTLSPGLEVIIKKATQKLPSERFQNCAEFINALNNYKSLESFDTNDEYSSISHDKTFSNEFTKTVSPTVPQSNYSTEQYQTYSQYTQTPYSGMPGILGSGKKKSNTLAIIVFVSVVLIFIIAGILIITFINSDNSDTPTKITQRNDTLNQGSEKDIYDSKTRPKLYFCETYDSKIGEIGVSNRFTTGYLTIMVDYRPLNKKIGLSNVYIRISKIKDEFGYEIKEKIINTISFTVKPDWDYIYFFDKKKINFTSAGTYKVSLLDDKYKYITHGIVEIVK